MQGSLQNSEANLAGQSRPPFTLPIGSPSADRVAASTVKARSSPFNTSRYCDVNFENDIAAVWIHLKANAPCKFTAALIKDLGSVHDAIESQIEQGRTSQRTQSLRYQVLASRIPGVFSLGGDLALLRQCTTNRDTRTLARYAQAAVSLVHSSADAFGGELTTIALVQGQALGGGFEAALAAHVLVAERSAKMAFPEVLFNMFPGMGAYQLLSRRLSQREAEQMILSGRTYSALELHALGVVDVLADDGEGEAAVRRYIRMHDRQHHARIGLRRALQVASPLDLDVLQRMAKVWVDTAMGLAPRDLDTIDYLLRAQLRHSNGAAETCADTHALQHA
ncbi:MAG: DSF synthase [Gammaproteobacteria bacterium]|jgi:DSF synthase